MSAPDPRALTCFSKITPGCRLIMPEPEADGSEFCHSQVVERVSVEARTDVPELLELVQETLDQVALSVCAL